MTTHDVIIIGLGAMGSAAACELARRGQRVIGLDRFDEGHDRGSSHGASRIIRLGYFEHPSYVPLLHRAYERWRELEAKSGRKLLQITGIIETGLPESNLVKGTLTASRLHNLDHDVLDAKEVMRRFPAYKLTSDYVGVWQPQGGFLQADAAVSTHLMLAQSAGADIRRGETVTAIEPHGSGVRVITDRGSIEASVAIVCAGAWAKKLLPHLAAPLRPTRQVFAWFEPRDKALFAPERFPVFIMESAHGNHYGFPIDQWGVKVGKHHHFDETVDPDTYDRTVSRADEEAIRAMLAEHMPQANGAVVTAKTCLYTMMPDSDFVIDHAASNIIVASPCSGHGFKFAPVVGEILADLAIGGSSRHDISRFRLGRFGEK
ncbi:MAG TPA: N-methyl-L-tryptophan oxidase [Xanthobacteraceae bacterium]|jgi:sarcosine oxidase|nr:N-methyl-L-tryptophan oxidase [Xanthobacteraceae bacterium]